MFQDLVSILSVTWLAAIFLIIGVALIIVEMFFPGIGVPGIAGIICIIVGFVMFAYTVRSVEMCVILFLIIAVVLGAAMFITMRLYSKGLLNRTDLVLSSELTDEAGFHSLETAGVEVGMEGIVTTTLRPVGVVEIGGVKREASSQSVFIQKGETVKVLSTEGRRIIVEPADKA